MQIDIRTDRKSGKFYRPPVRLHRYSEAARNRLEAHCFHQGQGFLKHAFVLDRHGDRMFAGIFDIRVDSS